MTDDQTDEQSADGFGESLLRIVHNEGDEAAVKYRCPTGYRVNHSGVWAVKETKDGEILIRVTYAPLIVRAIFTDPDGDQTVELAWTDRGRVVTRIVARSIAKRGRHLVAALGDAGLPVIEADSKQVERWLAALESINRNAIPRFYLARRLGWQEDGTFVTSQETPHRVEVKFDEQKPALAAHAPAGTFEGWQAAIKRMESYASAQMALYACLAAPLLQIVGVDSFTVDISGRSTRGKTTAAAAGMSLWADPSERSDGMYSWRTTMLALEKRLNLVNGLPVVVDETKLVKDPEFVHGVLYQIPKNHGQARGGGWPSGLAWRTVMVSTGEQSVLTFTTDQGAGARVLSVKSAPFGTDGPESAAAAVEVRDGCAENFGVAGPRFVEKLLDQLAGGGKKTIVARHKALTEAHKYSSDMSARRAPMVAALALAAELGHMWGIVPFPSPDAAVWAQIFAVSDQTDNRGEMALDVVREYVASHRRELWGPYTENDPPFGGWIGREITVDERPTIALLPERLKETLRKANYDLDSVISSWRESGHLVESASYRPPYLLGRNLNGSKVRLYVFNPAVFATDSEDGE
ncbi:DUF927 domain-containing protein [Streptomyces sp. H10-C2]|uniref:DUF927 domain-containing protein n=1 Tax=unclassified Streptomyces TaxID=2593676 RepID=UPI0024B99E04|nr:MULTISPECIES: DUF927 domain-containing protein [unclassified Streptomyces]MDJ0345955.1 DUF927 domain-containing protein [Streptomyces sp. PH10-H1]MDJ0373878.1 DUF927 domain-containing protein [Streptomyces sp. H10-C2]